MAEVGISGDALHLKGFSIFPMGTHGLARSPVGRDGLAEVSRWLAEKASSQGFSTIVLSYERKIVRKDGSIYSRPGTMTLDVANILGM